MIPRNLIEAPSAPRFLVFPPLLFGVGLLLLEREPFGIDRVHEQMEPPEIVTGYAVVSGILAESEIADRPLAAERAIVPIVLQCIEGPEIKVVPAFRLEVLVVGRYRLQPVLIGIGCGKFIKPVLEFRSPRAFQAATEGFSEFFASSSANSTSISETFPAHHSTAATTLRNSGSVRISTAFSDV